MKDKQAILNNIEDYLSVLDIPYKVTSDTYTAIGFKMEEFDTQDYREILGDLERIAPKDEFVHQWSSLYTITHIDDMVFPASVLI